PSPISVSILSPIVNTSPSESLLTEYILLSDFKDNQVPLSLYHVLRSSSLLFLGLYISSL
ncbi:MAG: hypothetical protein WD512_05565, partial [Candidatus Paceibacterota bacterium]